MRDRHHAPWYVVGYGETYKKRQREARQSQEKGTESPTKVGQKARRPVARAR